ncbi:MAG: glycosyltransferase family 2 protein [Ferruginibacter sp.]|nr:glycosyltransferase family 2 protein [Ferruginibacter sp.]
MKSNIDVSIIIVNYKTAQLVVDCIDSINKETNKYTYEIVVVDNESNDNSEEIIKGKHPSILWIQMGYNSGFARANNAGIKCAKGKYILLLNGDTIVLSNAIDITIDLLKQNEKVVACGVQLLNEDGTTQISGAKNLKGGLNFLLPIPYLGKFIRFLGYTFKSTIPSISEVQNFIEVDWIIGAFILAKRQAIDNAGLLDEDFFMYAEEMEWCSRLKKQGQLCLFGQPKVIHIGGGSSKDAYNTNGWDNSKDVWSKKARQIMLSNMVRIRKEFGVGWYLFIQGVYFLGIPVFILGWLAESVVSLGKVKYNWSNIKGYILNIITSSKYLFCIVLNKKTFYKVS